MKNTGLLAVIALTALPLRGQQPAVKHHPGEHLHYNVTLHDGDIGKVTGVSVSLRTSAPPPANQPNASPSFGGHCQQSSDPKVWTCDIEIPKEAQDGDYQLYHINVGTPEFSKSYEEDFHVPLVAIQNPHTFTPPSGVTVSQQP